MYCDKSWHDSYKGVAVDGGNVSVRFHFQNLNPSTNRVRFSFPSPPPLRSCSYKSPRLIFAISRTYMKNKFKIKKILCYCPLKLKTQLFSCDGSTRRGLQSWKISIGFHRNSAALYKKVFIIGD